MCKLCNVNENSVVIDNTVGMCTLEESKKRLVY